MRALLLLLIFWGTICEGVNVKKIREKVSYELGDQKIKAAEKLLNSFNKKNIIVKESFYTLSGFIDQGVFEDFFSKMSIFVQFLPETVKNTGMITSMLGNKKKYIKDFAERTHEELEFLAKEDALSSFSSMNNGKGLPKKEDVEKVKGILDWISHKQSLLKLMTKLWASEGLPALDVLMVKEIKLGKLF